MSSRSTRKHQRRGRNRRGGGGDGGGAAGNMIAKVGMGSQQTSGEGPSNAIKGLNGQSAGGRRASRKKKGGFWGQMINQAIVPFALFGLQQTYRRKRSDGNGTRRHHRRR